MFQLAVEHVLAVEGGLVENPTDPGGLTNMGISLRAHPELGRAGIINLTREQAIGIYRTEYWEPLGVDDSPWPLALLAFDAAVNSGLSRAQRWLRDHPTFAAFLAHRIRFYTRLESLWPTFGRGWMNRIATVVEATILDGPTRLGTYNPVVLHDLTWTDKWQVLITKPLRGTFIASQTPGSGTTKLDVRREKPP